MSEATITPGRFVWHELLTQDAARSQTFYEGVFGWHFDVSDPSYVHLLANGVPVGGMLQAPSPAMPTQWLPYVSVEDVDATASSALAAGCFSLTGAVDIERGRFALLQDPQGAMFYAWRDKQGDAPEVMQAPALGSFCWDHLDTSDPEAALAVYAQVFGWERSATTHAEDACWTLMRGERQAASLMRVPPQTHARWISHVVVERLDAARQRALSLGGTVLSECIEIKSQGAISVLQDDQGAIIAAFASESS